MRRGSDSNLRDVSREAFEQSSAPETLAAALRARLLPRLRAAPNAAEEAAAIVADLRRTGHELWRWDEGTGFSTWGADYVTPPLPTRFLIQMSWPSKDKAAQDVEVTFGPWPRDPGP